MNKMKKLLKSRIVSLAFCALLTLGVIAPSTVAYAADGLYYASWGEYTDAGNETLNWVSVADAMSIVFEQAKVYFAEGDLTAAYDSINHGYYGWYETTGFERIILGYVSGARVDQVELQFSACKSVAKNEGSYEDFAAAVDELDAMIRTDAHQLDGTTEESTTTTTTTDEETGEEITTTTTTATFDTAAFNFSASFGIMLREGFEAILIVGAIITYLKKSEEDPVRRRRKVMPIYIGSIVGIFASFGLAALLNAIKLANTASQEIIEGVTALLAVFVLYYVSNWMLSKSESDAWNLYIQSKVERSSEKGSLFALAFTAFLAVFREGAEVVLFFQPMLTGDRTDMVWAGFAVGCVCLVFVYIAIYVLSVRLPLKPFFVGTSVLMFIMSISFLGAGIKELIEGDVLTMTSPTWLQWIPSNDVLSVLGIYPVLETLIPQLILLAITVVVFVRTTKKNNAIHAAAEARRAEERLAQEKADAEAAKLALETEIRRIVKEIIAGEPSEPVAVGAETPE